MNATTIQRYQPGGDIFNALAAQYGTTAANQVAAAALSGDETQVNAVLTQIEFGNPLNTSTASLLRNQLATNPLGAPLSSLNTILKNAFAGLFSSPALLVALGITLFLVFGGGKLISKKVQSL